MKPELDKWYKCSVDKKVLKELKWKSKIPLNKGLSETFDWYDDNRSFFSKTSKKQFDKRLGLKI